MPRPPRVPPAIGSVQGFLSLALEHSEATRSRTPGREREVLQKGLDALDRAAGVRPHGYRSPSWDNSRFTFMRREVPTGVFTLTMHPQVIGRGHRMLLLERLIGWFKEHPGTRFSTLGAAADVFREAHPRETRS